MLESREIGKELLGDCVAVKDKLCCSEFLKEIEEGRVGHGTLSVIVQSRSRNSTNLVADAGEDW